MSATEQPSVIRVGKRQYDLGPTLGVGGFSEVKRGIDRQTGKRVALKITYTNEITNQKEMNSQLRGVQKEIKSMKKLNHINIVRLLGYDLKCNVEGKNAIVMVQELAPKGELFDYLMHTNKFDQPLAIAIFHQLIAALTVMHSAGIAHRDLKPENLLFDNDFNLKIVDFGFSYQYQKGSNPRTLMRTELGTKGYMAPEILNREKYTEAADIFAAGVILFICLAGFPPFQDAVTSDWWFDKLKKKKYRLFWMAHERTATFTPEAKDIIQRMLCADQNERINVNDIKSTAFYNAPHPDKNGLRQQLSNRKQEVDRKKEAERLGSRETRDLFQEAVINYKEDMKPNEMLSLKELSRSGWRNTFGKVTDAKELENILQNIAAESNKLKGLKKLDVNEINLEKVPELALTTEEEHIQEILKVNPKAAEELLKLLDTSDVLGYIHNYDPNYFGEFADLDLVELPLFDAYFYKTQSYKTPGSLGLLVYSLAEYLKAKNYRDIFELGVDTTSIPTISLTGEIDRAFEIPCEEGDEIVLQQVELPVKVAFNVSVFKDPTSSNNIVTFTNCNHATMEEFLQLELEITTDREYSLLANILSKDPVLNPESNLFDAETEVDGKMEEDDPELEALATEAEN